ncbi:hypothetical protein PXH59_02250 [Xenorhabdus sp. SF857]|uniref:hypothetical protein n=1 Tax=Xenorhabdus bakwenae TaxID=3026967 RepID=UPI0025580019|nr:hypothetical protein [Xenorhabdus sp. SF857]WFQ80032.1 hypothetical protein PXH59_02250 [Xenorhabdus sp. SF857]
MITLNLTPEIVNSINHKFESGLFVWQARWKANQHHRNRFLHKARQVGADYYFVLEALSDACRTGRNKFFMSNEEQLRKAWSQEAFEELFLCRLPHPR